MDFILLFMSTHASLWAQVDVNTTGNHPDASAGLDVDYPNKGMLIPRVSLASSTDNTTIPSPAASLLVYNTGTRGLTPAGYYYNAGTPASPNWVKFLVTAPPQMPGLQQEMQALQQVPIFWGPPIMLT